MGLGEGLEKFQAANRTDSAGQGVKIPIGKGCQDWVEVRKFNAEELESLLKGPEIFHKGGLPDYAKMQDKVDEGFSCPPLMRGKDGSLGVSTPPPKPPAEPLSKQELLKVLDKFLRHHRGQSHYSPPSLAYYKELYREIAEVGERLKNYTNATWELPYSCVRNLWQYHADVSRLAIKPSKEQSARLEKLTYDTIEYLKNQA